MVNQRCEICDWFQLDHPGIKKDFIGDQCKECYNTIQETLAEMVPEEEEEGDPRLPYPQPQETAVASNTGLLEAYYRMIEDVESTVEPPTP